VTFQSPASAKLNLPGDGIRLVKTSTTKIAIHGARSGVEFIKRFFDLRWRLPFAGFGWITPVRQSSFF
jgi:hypothetical protein